MSRPICTVRSPKRHGTEPVRRPKLTRTQHSGNRPSAQLIEQIRQLMERTIEFVTNPEFERADFLETVQAIRPKSLDSPVEFDQPKPGMAFVSGLVQSRLLTPDEERYLFTWMNFLKFRAEQNRRQLDLGRPDPSLVERIDVDLEEATHVRNHIVQGNLRLIVSLAKKMSVTIEMMSDLIGEGMIPLIRSVELFDVGLGNRFSTYATWAVRNQMLRWLNRLRTSRERFGGEDSPSLEMLPDQRPQTDLTEPVPQLKNDVVNRLMSSLSERERSIVIARFGLDGQPRGQSLADIAKQVGLSKERVRQIVLGSLSKLQGLMPQDLFEAAN